VFPKVSDAATLKPPAPPAYSALLVAPVKVGVAKQTVPAPPHAAVPEMNMVADELNDVPPFLVQTTEPGDPGAVSRALAVALAVAAAVPTVAVTWAVSPAWLLGVKVAVAVVVVAPDVVLDEVRLATPPV